MATISVSWTEEPETINLFSDSLPAAVRHNGELTCDHSASSYGVPVVVEDNGSVYGPAELRHAIQDARGACHYDLSLADDATAPTEVREICLLVLAARAAGFNLGF